MNELIDKWHNCYEDSWKDLIVPEAFAHPAKMAYGLTRRIFKHALSEGWIKPGDIVVDPFGGIGSTGIVGAHFGLQVVCVELEEKFCKLAKENFERHYKSIEMYKHFGKPLHPVIIQGDSRKLSEIIGSCDLLVSSPPFQESLQSGDTSSSFKNKYPDAKCGGDWGQSYGQTPGQLGAMKPGNIDMVISSPPYAESLSSDKTGIDWSKCHREDGSLRDMTKEVGHKTRHGADGVPLKYGSTPGNLGNLKSGQVDAIISSPPYAETLKGDGTQNETAEESRAKRRTAGGSLGQSQRTQGYGSKGNLGNIKPGQVDAIVSSPPYERNRFDGGNISPDLPGYSKGYRIHGKDKGNYSETQGQLGNEQGETFWQAAKQIVSECHKILKDGGYAIWVVKAFVRNKKIVDFPGDWRKLCESCGFETLHEHHAMLLKERKLPSLFGDTIINRTKRNSFFRKLGDSKGAYRNYWKTINKTEQDKWLEDAEEFLKNKKPTKFKILSLAQKGIFLASGEDEHDWNEDIRIDYEVVLCTRKAENSV